MSAMTMNKVDCDEPTAAGTVAGALALAARAPGPGRGARHHGGPDRTFNLTRAAGVSSTSRTARRSIPGATAATAAPAGFAPTAIADRRPAPTMQVPGPTLIVTEGETVTVTLTNNLPTAGRQHLDPVSRIPGGSRPAGVRRSCWRRRPHPAATRDLHVHGDVAGNARLLQRHAGRPAGRDGAVRRDHRAARKHPGGLHAPGLACAEPDRPRRHWGETDFRLAAAAYDHPKTCYDREYLFQFSEMDPNIHTQALAQVTAAEPAAPPARSAAASMVPTEPYHPTYFLINGRSMPDDMDPNYAPQYPHQPYNGNPHMHPGELVLLRDHRPGPLAASVPRACQPRAHPGARRQPDPEPPTDPTQPAPARCCSRRPPRRAWRWTASSTGPARA